MTTPKGPGLRLHARTMTVHRAEGELGMMLVELQQRHDLTDIEMIVIMTAQLQSLAKYPLRAERHPDDPSRKADEQ